MTLGSSLAGLAGSTFCGAGLDDVGRGAGGVCVEQPFKASPRQPRSKREIGLTMTKFQWGGNGKEENTARLRIIGQTPGA